MSKSHHARQDAAPRAPLGRRRLDFSRLDPTEFELLCFYAIAIDFPEVVRVADPDGGVDTALPEPDRSWARCWQAKRYTSQVKWKECRDSFDAAVETYAMPHYTFCFARDLTQPQEALFKTHLVGRKPGVTVDYWGASRLEASLFSTEQGKRIAAEFFGDPEADTRSLARAMRAAGDMSTGARVLDRLAAIAEQLHEHDPFYTYVTVTAEVGSPRPELSAQTVLAVEKSDGQSVVRVEAIPRPATLPDQLPRGTLFMTPPQAEQFERFLSRGGDLELDAVRVDFFNLPRELEDLDPSGEQMRIVMRAPETLPAPWDARFSIVADGVGVNPIVIHLEPTREVPSDWDAGLCGETGAFGVTVLFRKRGDRGQMTVQWSYTDDPTQRAQLRANQLNFLEAMHHRGKLVIEDVAGPRPRLEFDTVERGLPDDFQPFRIFVSDLATIEEWTGREYRVLDRVPAREVRAIHDMAHIIRTGESSMNFEHVTLTMPRDKANELLEGDNQFLIEIGVGLAVLGQEIPIGRLQGIVREVAVKIEETARPDSVDVVLAPATPEAAHPSFRLVRESDPLPPTT